jgi:hypothetical protein
MKTILPSMLLLVAVLFVLSLPIQPEAQQSDSNPAFKSNARLTNSVRFLDIDEPQLAVTTLSAANTTVTLTLPAAGTGLFHYITSLVVVRSCTTAIVGTALLAYTSTNLPGSLAWSSGNACAVGSTNFDVDTKYLRPVKSSAANTATTIIAPAAGVAGLIRLTAYYHIGL